jgi:hypothetical protein
MLIGYSEVSLIPQHDNGMPERYVVVGLAILQACVILAGSGFGESWIFSHYWQGKPVPITGSAKQHK